MHIVNSFRTNVVPCVVHKYMSHMLIINSLSTSTCKLIDGSVENLHFGTLLTVRINELKLVCPKLNVHNHWKVVTRTSCIYVHTRVECMYYYFILGRADYAQGTSLVPDPIKINTMNVVATQLSYKLFNCIKKLY